MYIGQAYQKMSSSTSENVTFASQQHPTSRRNPLSHMMFLVVHGRKLVLTIFQHKSHDNLLVTDQFSNFTLVRKCNNQTAAHVVSLLKTIFSEHGILVCMFTDQERQLTSVEKIAKYYQFEILHSTPRYP